jgi:hypothetical protein
MKHKEPIMGSLHWPYRETGMSGFGHYPWWAFCIPHHKTKVVKNKNNKYKNMKKWEYRVEGVNTKNFNDEKSIKELKDFLSQIGSEGWELTGVVPTSQQKEGLGQDFLNMKKCLLIFKREGESK